MKNDTTRNILIVGATGGIGEGVARYLNSQKYQCILCGRNEGKLKKLSSQFSGLPYIRCDFEHSDAIAVLFDFLKQKQIKLDGMVYCAGIAPLMSVADNDDVVMRQAFQINFFTFVTLMQQFQKADVSNDYASVVAMSSIATACSAPRQTVYAASKSALDTAIHAMAKEFVSRKIRINSILSGGVDTAMLRDLETKSPQLRDKLKNLYPLGVIPIEQIAYAVEFLLSPKAACITGTNMVVDSGFMVNR